MAGRGHRGGWVPNRRALHKAVAALLVVALTTALATSFSEAGIVLWLFAATLWFGVPAIPLGVALLLFRRRATGWRLIVAGTLIPFAFAFSLLYGIWEVNASLTYCESEVCALAAYRCDHGAYPESLDQVSGTSWLKPLRIWFHGADATCNYHTSGERVSFGVPVQPEEGQRYWCSWSVGSAATYRAGRLERFWPFHCSEGY